MQLGSMFISNCNNMRAVSAVMKPTAPKNTQLYSVAAALLPVSYFSLYCTCTALFVLKA